MSEKLPDTVVWTVFTESQRRRAEALLLASLLFPTSTCRQALQVAQWITRGNPDVGSTA